MRKRLSLLIPALATLILAAGTVPASGDEQADSPKEEAAGVSFLKEVAPLLTKNCLACHNAKDSKGGFNLTTFESLMKGGEEGDTVVPGDGEFSNLSLVLTDGTMPKDSDPLPQEQIDLITKWIDEGAKFDGSSPTVALVTLIPRVPQPAAPETYRVPVAITALAFSPDGSQLAAAGYHEVTIWNPADGALVRRITNLAQRTYGIAFSPDGMLMATASGTPGELGEVKVWNPADGTLVKDLLATSDSEYAVAFSPDGKYLAACGADRAIRIWEVETGVEKVLVEDHADWVMGLAWSPDGKQLASASRDKTCKVFNTETGESLVTFPGHGEPVFAVCFSKDGKLIATAGRDKQIRLWNPADAKQTLAIGGHESDIYALVYSADGSTLYTGSADKTARQFNVGDGKQVRAFEGHTDWIYSLSLHAESKRIATGSWDGEIRIWNAEDGAHLTSFVAAPGYKPTETASAQAAAETAK